MSIKNDDVLDLIDSRMKELQEHLNSMEGELAKGQEKVSLSYTAISLGKAMKLYQELAYYLGVFDGHPKYKN